jgi:hypothetical protein
MLKETFIAAACALGIAVPAGALAADSPTSITLRVPVQLKKMLAEQVGVFCLVRVKGEPAPRGSAKSAPRKIVNGEFNEVIEVRVTPASGKDFNGVDQYACYFHLDDGKSPYQGTPPVGNIKVLAKPDEFYRRETVHDLEGGKVGVGGPKDLKGQKP